MLKFVCSKMESCCNFLHNLFPLPWKTPSDSDCSYRQKDLKHILFLDVFIWKRKVFFFFFVPKILERNKCRNEKIKEGCLSGSFCKMLWQWCAAISIFLMEKGTEFQNWSSLCHEKATDLSWESSQGFQNCPSAV